MNIFFFLPTSENKGIGCLESETLLKLYPIYFTQYVICYKKSNKFLIFYVCYANGRKTLAQPEKPVLERLLAQREVCAGWLLWTDTSEVSPILFYQCLTTTSNTMWVPAVIQEPDSADLRPYSTLTMRNNTRSLCQTLLPTMWSAELMSPSQPYQSGETKSIIPLLCLSANQDLYIG